MANTVFKLRRSSVAGKTPNTSTLAIGELALNLTDRKLYSSDGTNVWETGSNLASLAVSSNTTVNNLIITGGLFANGIDGAEGQVLTSNGTAVYWSSVSGGSASAQVRQQFVGDGSTTSFTITDGYESNTLSVFLNGVLLRNGLEANVQSGSSVVISPAPANGSLIDVVGVSTIYPSVSISVSGFISVGNDSVNTQITPGNVFLNGSTLVIGNTSSNITVNSTALSIGGSVINSSGVSGNLSVGGALLANGSAGLSSQVLTSNGSGIYWSSAGVNTAAQYTWTNTQTFSNTITFNSVINGTANAANYLGGNSASDLRNYSDTTAATAYSNAIAYSGNSVAAYTNAVSYTDSKILTANSAITGNAATAYTNAVAYVDGKSYVNTSQLTNNLSNYALLSGATFTGNVVANNANTTYDLNVGRNLTVGGNLTITGNVTIIGANNLSIVDNFIYLNSNNTTQNVDLGWAGNYNDGSYHHAGFFRDASDGVWKVFDNYDPEPDANVNIDTTNTSFHIANFQANAIYVGNTSVYSTVNTTNFTGTSNNTLFVGSVSAANVVSNAQLSANLGNYQTTAGLSANVATLTANLANYVVANDGIVSNSSGVFVKAGTGIAVNATGVHVTAGVNTDAQYTWANIQTFNANLVLGTGVGISVGGSYGNSGDVLFSNGSAIYWAKDSTVQGAFPTGDYGDITGSQDSFGVNILSILTFECNFPGPITNTDLGTAGSI